MTQLSGDRETVGDGGCTAHLSTKAEPFPSGSGAAG